MSRCHNLANHCSNASSHSADSVKVSRIHALTQQLFKNPALRQSKIYVDPASSRSHPPEPTNVYTPTFARWSPYVRAQISFCDSILSLCRAVVLPCFHVSDLLYFLIPTPPRHCFTRCAISEDYMIPMRVLLHS